MTCVAWFSAFCWNDRRRPLALQRPSPRLSARKRVVSYSVTSSRRGASFASSSASQRSSLRLSRRDRAGSPHPTDHLSPAANSVPRARRPRQPDVIHAARTRRRSASPSSGSDGYRSVFFPVFDVSNPSLPRLPDAVSAAKLGLRRVVRVRVRSVGSFFRAQARPPPSSSSSKETIPERSVRVVVDP